MKKHLLRFAALWLLAALLLTASGCGSAGSGNTSSALVSSDPASSSSAAPVSSAASEAPRPIPKPTGRRIVIDAGHQLHGNYDTEPIGPGAAEQKAKVSSGTQGVVTRLEEYQLTLTLALALEEELEARGYEVIQVRRTNDVDISNAARANIANLALADAFLRLHANGSDDPAAHGAMTICQTKANYYNGDLHDKAYRLAQTVLDGLVTATGCRRERVWETDSMSGINWCRVPATIVEVGYMSNPEEDRKLSDPDYQKKIVTGIADGLDRYFENP